LLASLKTLTNSIFFSESSIKFLFRVSFALTGRFFHVYIQSRLSEQISGFQAVTEKLLEAQAATRKPEQAL
jgi:hypothetical protein